MPGKITLPGGQRLIAGEITLSGALPADGAAAWTAIALPVSLAAAPTVLTGLQSANNMPGGTLSPGLTDPWIVTAVDSLSTNGFELALDSSAPLAAPENVAYIVIEPGVTALLPADGTIAVEIEAVGPTAGIVGPDDNPDANIATPFPIDCAQIALQQTYLLYAAGRTSRGSGEAGFVRHCVPDTASNAVALTVDEDYDQPAATRSHIGDTVSVVGFSRPFHASFGIVADYQFDDCALGNADVVIDDSGPFGLDGVGNGIARVSVISNPSPGRQCQAAGISAARTMIDVADNALLDLRGALSLAAWINHGGAGDDALATEYQTVVGKGIDAYRLSLEKVCVADNGLSEPVVDRTAALTGCAPQLDVLGDPLIDRRWRWVGRLDIVNPAAGAAAPLFVTTAPIADGAFWDPTGEIVAGNWYHLSANYDGFSLQIRLDAQTPKTFSAGGSLLAVNTNDTPLTIGYSQDGAGGEQNGFGGTIDEVTIWQSALPFDEIDTEHRLRTRDCLPCERQLIYWREVYQR